MAHRAHRRPDRSPARPFYVLGHPTWRATGMGVYRMWRDAGYGVGAIVIGLVLQGVSIDAAFYLVGLLMFVSGAVVVGWMEETHPDFGTHTPPLAHAEPTRAAEP